MYAVGGKLYQSAAPQGQPGQPNQGGPQQPGAGSSAGPNGNVYNAEYHDVDDKDKK